MIGGDVTQTGGHCAKAQQFPNAKRRAATNELLNERRRLAGDGICGGFGCDDVTLEEGRVVGFMKDI